MVNNHYRWDFIGLSTDEKPTPATSEKVVDGSTFYCSDNSKLYVWCKDNWYEKTVSGGGTTYTAGDGITIANDEISVDLAQTTGNSTTKVMSQDATTKMVYRSSSNIDRIQIGDGANAGGANSVIIGKSANTGKTLSVAIGANSNCGHYYSVALGAYSETTSNSQVNIGVTNSNYGYNNSYYRLLTGVHDPVDAHDAATKGYVDQTLTTLFIDTLNFPSDPNTPLTGQHFYKEKELLSTYSLSEIRDRIMTGNVRLCAVDNGDTLNFYNFFCITCSANNLDIWLGIQDIGSSSIIEFTADSNTQDEFTFSTNPV